MNFSIILIALSIHLAQQPGNCAGMLDFAKRLYSWRMPSPLSSSGKRQLLSDSGKDSLKPDGFIHLKIENFAEFEKTGKELISEPALIRGLPWRLVVNCADCKPENTYSWEDHLNTQVRCDGEPGSNWNIDASLTFRVLSLTEDKKDIEKTLPTAKSFSAMNKAYGIPDMVKIKDLMKPENGWYDPKHDFIMVEVHIKADPPKGITYEQISKKMPVPINKRMCDLLESGKGANVKFLVGPEEGEKELITAHKAILMAASDVFEKMFNFYEEQNIKKDTFEEKEVNIEAFKMLLKYIYTDDLSGLNEDNLYDVLNAAQKFNVVGVFRTCVEYMQLDTNNVLTVLAMAKFFKEESLMNRCWGFVDQNVFDLIAKDEFVGIDQEMLDELLGRDQLMMYRKPWKGGEMALWRAALRWADEQCRRKELDISAENRRQMLGPALYKIRFPLIKQEDFSSEIAHSEVLSMEEVISVYTYHSHPADQAKPGKYPLEFSTTIRG